MSQKSDAAKEKARWARIKRIYGIDEQQFKQIDLGHCHICLRDWSVRVLPCVDHDHSTGEIRGIICRYCNHRLVGRHRDSNVLRRIADYLDAPRKGWIVPKKKKKRKKRNVRPRKA